ncbi:hypothetical protein SprV_0902750800 [Sparganum proliferum]
MPFFGSDGSTLLTEKSQLQKRWSEHLRSVHNRPCTISDAAIVRLLQVETNADLDFPFSLHETIGVVQRLYNVKALASDAISTEVHKHDSHRLVNYLTSLFQVPQDFKDSTKSIFISHFVTQHRRKGLPRILLNRINGHPEQGLLPESQCGLPQHLETTAKMFSARQLQEKCQEFPTYFYTTYLNLAKASDTTNCD